MNLINTEQCVDDIHVIFHCGCELGEVLEELLISGNRHHFLAGALRFGFGRVRVAHCVGMEKPIDPR